MYVGFVYVEASTGRELLDTRKQIGSFAGAYVRLYPRTDRPVYGYVYNGGSTVAAANYVALIEY